MHRGNDRQKIYGARDLDPKYSRWISTDPALGEYIPGAPTDEEVRRQNQNLPGMGGVFNTVNANLYHYAGNNPVKYTDPDGKIAFCAVTALIGAGIGVVYGVCKSYSETKTVNWREVGKDALIGAAIGMGAGLIGAQVATSTALQAGNCLAGFGEVTGIGTASATGIAGVASTADFLNAPQNFSNNTLNHIFGKPEHNFSSFLLKFGGDQNKALDTIYNTAMDMLNKSGFQENQIFDSVKNPIVIKIGDYTIKVGGKIIDGVLKIGTAYIE